MKGARVCLVSMPFHDQERPALGISLLQPAVRNAGFDCDNEHASFAVASLIGVERYRSLWEAGLCAESVFVPALHGRRRDRAAAS